MRPGPLTSFSLSSICPYLHTSTRPMQRLKGIFKRKQRNPRDENKAIPPPSSPSTPNSRQQSMGLSPSPPPQIQTQKPDEPSHTWRVAKSGLTLALELTEIVLGAIPIPGAKAPFTIALRIIKGIDVGYRSLLSWNFLHLNWNLVRLLLRMLKCSRKSKHMSRIYATTS